MDNSICNIIVSVIIGIATGIISSVIVTIYYRKKDNAREKAMFFRQLIRHLSQMAYQLNKLYQQTDSQSNQAESFDTFFEDLLATYRNRPVIESYLRFTSFEKDYIDKYSSLSSTIREQLNEYNRIKNVLIALEHDNHYADVHEIQQLRKQQYSTAISLGCNVATCYSLRDEIDNLQSGKSPAAQKA